MRVTKRTWRTVKGPPPLLALLGLAIGCGVQGSGGTWPSASLGQVSSSADSLVAPAIAVDATGKPVVAYVAQGVLLVGRWDGAAWTQLGSAVNTGAGPAKLPALALDSSGLAIAWEDTATATHLVRAARFDGAAWNALGAQINASGTAARQPRIAAGGQGIVVAYSGGNPPAAVVTRWTGTAWQDWPATPSLNATEVEMSLLPDGNPEIAWVHQTAATGTVQWEVATRYWSSSSNAWATLPALSFRYSPNVSLTAGADGTVYLASDVAGDPPAPVRKASPSGSDWQLIDDPAGASATAGPMALLPVSGIALGFALDPITGGVARYTGSSWELIARIQASTFSFAGAADGALYVTWSVGQGQPTPSPIEVVRFQHP